MPGKHERNISAGWVLENFCLRGADVYWKVPHAHYRKLDQPAGYVAPHGYRMIKVAPNGQRCFLYAHRVSFCLAHGRWPEGHIDHVDGDRANNEPGNLREGCYTTNNRNKARGRNNKSGVLGVRKSSRFRWRAQIGKSAILGTFPTFEQAVAARRAAEAESGYHENHGRA